MHMHWVHCCDAQLFRQHGKILQSPVFYLASVMDWGPTFPILAETKEECIVSRVAWCQTLWVVGKQFNWTVSLSMIAAMIVPRLGASQNSHLCPHVLAYISFVGSQFRTSMNCIWADPESVARYPTVTWKDVERTWRGIIFYSTKNMNHLWQSVDQKDEGWESKALFFPLVRLSEEVGWQESASRSRLHDQSSTSPPLYSMPKEQTKQRRLTPACKFCSGRVISCRQTVPRLT
jgi:hypothetical protein